ncbi:MAG: ATP-dependent sacrificial sulfur transferase LarE [bacterium]
MTAAEKELELRRLLRSLDALAVAYSGGVDSTYLLKIAAEELGDQALGITAISSTYPERERQRAESIVQQIAARHIYIHTKEIGNSAFSSNNPDRCYHCKKELFRKIREVAVEQGIQHIADGSNQDDNSDYRPGRKALQELEVLSPLEQCGFTKDDIRLRSRELGLPTWDLPAFACLASRIPYGKPITEKSLRRIEAAEDALYRLGFRVVRVRHYDETARLEIGVDEIPRMLDQAIREQVVENLKIAGYTFVTLDLEGYRTGSMNRMLTPGEKT